MSTVREWDRVRAMFQAALEQPPEAREAFLSAACEGSDALRDEVRSLLAAHTAAGGFLETPALRFEAAPPQREPLTLKAGDRLGRFEITARARRRRHGGGLSRPRSQLGREVAIKILPPAYAARPERLARFEREARVLASLNHPNIAAIHSIEDVGGLRCWCWSWSTGRRSPTG